MGGIVMEGSMIRAASAGDEEIVVSLLRDLAEYEKLLDKFHITESIVTQDYFSDAPMMNCDLAFVDDEPVGLSTWYWTYHSFAAKRGIFLEDLYVKPEMRGKGYGKFLLENLAQTAMQFDCLQIEWEVLPWNKPSIDFYESLGAKNPTDWLVYKLHGHALKKLADG
jgi:GNAT superfamily N-acetyltransferase